MGGQGAEILEKGRRAIAKKAGALAKLEVEYVDIESVKPNGYNPNRQSERDFELLLLSMREDGFTQPIVAHRGTREIVDGEHRWRAARHLGLAQVPVVFVDMTAEQMRISTLRHNRARGSEDVDLSAKVLADLRELGALDWAQDSLMLDDAELDRILKDVPVAEALAGDSYGEAWAPTRASDEEHNRPDFQVSMSEAAQQRTEELRGKMEATGDQAARAQIERQELRKEIVRVNFTFRGAEADLVKGVLGVSPAQALLALCHEERALRAAQGAPS